MNIYITQVPQKGTQYRCAGAHRRVHISRSEKKAGVLASFRQELAPAPPPHRSEEADSTTPLLRGLALLGRKGKGGMAGRKTPVRESPGGSRSTSAILTNYKAGSPARSAASATLAASELVSRQHTLSRVGTAGRRRPRRAVSTSEIEIGDK